MPANSSLFSGCCTAICHAHAYPPILWVFSRENSAAKAPQFRKLQSYLPRPAKVKLRRSLVLMGLRWLLGTVSPGRFPPSPVPHQTETMAAVVMKVGFRRQFPPILALSRDRRAGMMSGVYKR
eukprot:scaffold97_cov261-Pinguiococcus_pyrenoidosus.AAC.21